MRLFSPNICRVFHMVVIQWIFAEKILSHVQKCLTEANKWLYHELNQGENEEKIVERSIEGCGTPLGILNVRYFLSFKVERHTEIQICKLTV